MCIKLMFHASVALKGNSTKTDLHRCFVRVYFCQQSFCYGAFISKTSAGPFNSQIDYVDFLFYILFLDEKLTDLLSQ